MKVVKKVDFNSNADLRRANLPQEALNSLEVLDNLEAFTISIRKKIAEEIRSTSKLIHVRLDAI